MTHTNWRILSDLIGLPQSCIHFIEPEVGGGFGARGEFYPEDFLIPFRREAFSQTDLLDRRPLGKSQGDESVAPAKPSR